MGIDDHLTGAQPMEHIHGQIDGPNIGQVFDAAVPEGDLPGPDIANLAQLHLSIQPLAEGVLHLGNQMLLHIGAGSPADPQGQCRSPQANSEGNFGHSPPAGSPVTYRVW